MGLFGGYGIRFAESLSIIEEDAAHQMGKLVRGGEKPIVMHSLFSSARPHSLDLMRYYGIPVYDALDVACKSIGVLSEYGRYLKSYDAVTNFSLDRGAKARSEGREILDTAMKEGRRVLLEHEAKNLLRLHDIPMPNDRLARTADEAAAAAQSMGVPVAMKIVSPDILHKSDAGGVKLGLEGDSEVKRAFGEIMGNGEAYNPEADIRGILVSPMADDGVEVIIGTKIDDQFGPVIMFGLGGIWVEILKDVSFRVLPITPLSVNFSFILPKIPSKFSRLLTDLRRSR